MNDPLIGVIDNGSPRRVSLPQLLARLSAGSIEGYTGLRAHQADPWHVLTVQLAAAVLARQPRDEPPEDETYWKKGLLELSRGIASAWYLVEPDVTKPAFFQHPWRNRDAQNEGYRPKAFTPDELDVLVTAKNHDVKTSRMSAGSLEAWIYALMMLQTTSGYLGAGNFGIVRMNGGFASRPIVSWTVDRHLSRRFLDELHQVRRVRTEVLKRNAYGYSATGLVLTWLDPWNRNSHQYVLRDLDPRFVEACRPVRLFLGQDGTFTALCATSKARQIGPRTLDNGDVGDPWIPINTENRNGHAALTLTSDGFTPRRVVQLLFEQGFQLTPLQRPRSDQPGWFVGSVFVRGQGKTEGFHRLELPVPGRAVPILLRRSDDPHRQQVAKVAQEMLTDASNAASALRFALTVLVKGGAEKAAVGSDAIAQWVDAGVKAFSREWPREFYPMLWRACTEPAEAVRKDWQRWLVNAALARHSDAVRQLPQPENRRWRALIESRRALRGVLRKHHLLPLADEALQEESVA
ncbi:MAG: type I-E CRISPR-associated protein Cse1/CasA [Burkholderiales bacterium]|nr:type I-E CRISPR-associated protein Cse1/CasA [Burkholderiales bacterium]